MTVRRSPPSGLESQEDRSRPSSSLSFSHLNFYGLFTPSFDGQHASSPSGSQARLRELPIHRVLTRPFDPTPLQFVPLSLLYNQFPVLTFHCLLYPSSPCVCHPHGLLLPPPPRFLLCRRHSLLHSPHPISRFRQSRWQASRFACLVLGFITLF